MKCNLIFLDFNYFVIMIHEMYCTLFLLGVPTVPLLPPQANPNLTPVNPASTLPGKW